MGGVNSGGSRQGQQGKIYTNRIDLMQNRTPQQAPVSTPTPHPVAQPQTQQAPPSYSAPTPEELYQTQRPQEPITHGLAGGPGAGPEALPASLFSPVNGAISSILDQLAQQSGASDLADLAAQAKAFGQ